ncbi:MAG: tannase/feruloyl esterase family alpha/beta hydrolase [Alphaproteobacteria bacterium]|nr:tannase/feruloyl esterase family alpha/beta hydrolase [Alphaproteobacteria bacterium]MDE2493497.1 tannase/feruloyl esterase family alpha/beta hydrolase [Alphaproteobacteria bacterium]
MKITNATAVCAVMAALVTTTAPLYAGTGAEGPSACSVEHVAGLVSAPIHIDRVIHVAAVTGVPTYCSIFGHIDHGSQIGFVLGLPDQWNKRYLFFGIGGFAGKLDPIESGLTEGYATGTSDTGHKGTSVQDASWALNNPVSVLNHFESGTALAARDLKAITAAYYGQVPMHSYFQGCSAGGRQAVVEAERFPSTFDGIIAGSPAWDYSKLLITFIENGETILKSKANWIPSKAFTAIDTLAAKTCGSQDGVQDGIITDPRQCKTSLKVLLCRPGKKDPSCLTPAQRSTIDNMVTPRFAVSGQGYFGYNVMSGSDRDVDLSWGWPKWFFGTKPPLADKTGRLAFRGDILPQGGDVGIGPNQFLLGEQFLRYIAFGDPNYDARMFAMKISAKSLETRLGGLLDADDTDLGPFIRMGGKLIIWHGWADPAIPPAMSIDLYERIRTSIRTYPGQPSIDQSVRLFMVPGVQHCGGGAGLTQFDPLKAMVNWVENDKAPARIMATQVKDDKPILSRPLCPFPKTAHYDGTGNPDDAASFICK